MAGGAGHVEHVMGTAVSFLARGPWPDGALADAVALLHDVDATFSTYREDSQVRRLDRGDLVAADARSDVLEVLEACEALRVDTGGWFDAWAARAGEVAHLDPSGYVKGWAIDRAAAVLARAGVTSYCINAGGDVLARAGGDEPPWRIGIRHPADPRAVVAVVAGRRLAVATSAAYERGNHIVYPHRGSAPSGLRSLTVVGDDLALVDAYATAGFAVGATGPAWLAARTPFGVFAVTDAGRAVWDDRFAAVRAA